MKLSIDTKVELQHAMIRADELRNHHLNQADIAVSFIEIATKEETMAKFLRIAKYHAKQAEYYQKMGDDLRKVLFGYEK